MRFALFCTALLAVLILPGCSSSSISTSSGMHVPYFTSKDSALQYRLPAGWFDATADSSAAGNIIWLLREDYAATIAVQEIKLDEAARQELTRGGLLKVARLTTMLATGDRPTLVRKEPELIQSNGRNMCAYELSTAAKENIRVVLVEAAGKVYSVTALAAANAKRDDVFSTQQAFANSLRWSR